MGKIKRDLFELNVSLPDHMETMFIIPTRHQGENRRAKH